VYDYPISKASPQKQFVSWFWHLHAKPVSNRVNLLKKEIFLVNIAPWPTQSATKFTVPFLRNGLCFDGRHELNTVNAVRKLAEPMRDKSSHWLYKL